MSADSTPHIRLTKTLAERVAARMRRDGFDCDVSDVEEVWHTGTLRSYEALASRILQEFEELGFSEHAG